MSIVTKRMKASVFPVTTKEFPTKLFSSEKTYSQLKNFLGNINAQNKTKTKNMLFIICLKNIEKIMFGNKINLKYLLAFLLTCSAQSSFQASCERLKDHICTLPTPPMK